MPIIAMLLSNAFRPDPRVYKEAHSLVEAGYQVNVVCWDRTDEFPEKEIVQGIHVHRVKIRSKYSAGSRQLIYLPRYWIKAYQLLNQIQPNIIHCHDLDTTIGGAWYAHVHKIPWIYDAHECYPEQIGPQVNHLIYSFLKVYERFISPKSDMLITVEESLAEHFRSHGAKVTVVGNYPDLEAFLPLDTGITRQKIGIPNNAYIVAYIGGFTLARAILPLIYVTDLLPDITILIAGDGPQRKVIEEAIAGRKNIYYLGWIHHNLVPAYMNLSDVIYYGLKIDDGNSRYSAPNALFNSMAVGKPILTTDIGDISRIVKNEKCGVVVPDSSPENLAYGLKLLRDSYLREKYGENSKKAAIEKYNWEIAKKNLLEVYSKLL